MAITVKNLKGVQSSKVCLALDLSTRIKEDILSGKLPRNTRLTEQSIGDAYQVSRTPVREALVQLEMEGLIENVHHRGAFVIGLSPRDMEDIFVLRKIYEVQATGWAIERISEEEMDELEETFEFMEFYTMKKDIDKMLNINETFHQMIYKAAGNRLLSKLLSSYQLYMKYHPSSHRKEANYLPTVLEEHRQIFLAFKEKDPQRGREAMALHMDLSHQRFKKT